MSAACTAPPRPGPGPAVLDLVEPWPALVVYEPLLMLPEPGSTNNVVIERAGRVVRFNRDDAAVSTPDELVDVQDRVAANGSSELGLLGIAYHPDYPNTREVYLSYTADGSSSAYEDRLSRFAVNPDGTFDAGSEEILLAIPDFAGNHNGGMIQFANDGMLYLGTGDGGGGGDPNRTAQNGASLLGKMLRIDVDTASAGLPYGIPADNPFTANATIRDEVWALGLRNPWRWSFDRTTGVQWLGDVGQGAWEEVNTITRGGNYGWSIYEGDSCYNGPCDTGGTTAPLLAYDHNGRVAITGGFVYRGSAIPSLVGTYLFGEYVTGEIFALTPDGGGGFLSADNSVAVTSPGLVSSFSEDADGELYVLDNSSGTIRRIVATAGGEVGGPPADLVDTGCVNPSDPSQPADGMLPYGLNFPFYSDGAAKERFVSIPDGTQATVLSSGDIDFPIGTVLLKMFRIQGEMVETRLFVRHDDGGWAGYSYRWNDAGTAATLVTGSDARLLPTGNVWSFPSGAQCLACHTAAAGRTLGLEVGQLNGAFTYAETGRTANQLVTWDALGLLSTGLPAPATALPSLPRPTDTSAAVDLRARAYLHANCSSCHMPGGGGGGGMDFRASASPAAFNACDVPPSGSTFNIANARILAPGDPARSIVSVRMHLTGAGRMPLMGSNVVDAAGTALIDSYIRSLATCP